MTDEIRLGLVILVVLAIVCLIAYLLYERRRYKRLNAEIIHKEIPMLVEHNSEHKEMLEDLKKQFSEKHGNKKLE